MLIIILSVIVLSFLRKQIQIDLIKEPWVNASNVNQHISWLLPHSLPIGRGAVAVIYNYAVQTAFLTSFRPEAEKLNGLLWTAVGQILKSEDLYEISSTHR